MAQRTYQLIERQTLASSAGSVTFSSIPQDYRDLVLVAYVNKNASGVLELQFNGDTGSNYKYVRMQGNGSSGISSSGTQTAVFASPSTTIDSIVRVEIMDYAETDKHKTVLVRSDDAADKTVAVANRWEDTSAISTVLISSDRNFQAGSTFAIYGIAA